MRLWAVRGNAPALCRNRFFITLGLLVIPAKAGISFLYLLYFTFTYKIYERPCCYIVSMAFSYKYFLLLLAAFVLLSCEQNHSDATSKNSRHTKKIESFVRDTSAYVMVVDTSVHDSAFRKEIVPVDQGGFT